MAESQKSQFVGEKDAVARSASKMVVHEIATGRVTQVWPIDARELVQSGEYAYGESSTVAEKPAPSADVVGSIGTPASGSAPISELTASLSDAELEAQFQAELAAAEKAELEKAAADKAAADTAAAGSGSAPSTSTTTSRRRTSTSTGS